MKFFLIVVLLVLSIPVFSQIDVRRQNKTTKTEDNIVVNGILDEPIWLFADSAVDFTQHFPFDSSFSKSKSMVRTTYDQNYFYVSIVVIDSLKGDYVSTSLRRDFRGSNIDAFAIIIDPFLDQTNGFYFAINPYNVQSEGLIANGGATSLDLDLSWDNKWYSSTRINDYGWIAEIAIPFKTLRFKEGIPSWGINFCRFDTKYNERSVWNRVPQQFEIFNLAFTGRLNWNQPPPKVGANVVLIPYSAVGTSKNFIDNSGRDELAVGGDVKIGVTQSLNLDLTVNPDFSQVEVDVQQTNLDRFELFFPERRQFFLENADLFSGFGFANAAPFFSRRIGVGIDSKTGQNIQNRIVGGARLSGKIGSNWRVGVMNMYTDQNEEKNLPAYNYAVAAVQRKVFRRSNVSAIYVGKNNFDGQPVDVTDTTDGSSNQLIGLDYNLASADGKWTGKAYYHNSFNETDAKGKLSHGVMLNYNTLKYFGSWTHQIIENGFDAKVGFVPRTDFNRVNPVIGFNYFPKSKRIIRHQFSMSNNVTWNKTRNITDYNFAANWGILFRNTARFNFSLLSNYVQLFSPFNPTGDSSNLFQSGDSFSQTGFLTSFQSNQRQPFNFLVQIISGQYYNGSLRQISGNFNYRYRQYATIALNYNINRIILTRDFKSADLFLVGPRIDITFSNKFFWTTFLQYNSQFDNFNINSRLQWRFRPVSDFFLVYTDNYFPETFKVKNRAIVFKFTYWLNL
ncbi:MAG: carbohydrate binding family 9 domain-containing protein [Cytophagales bacterium]|jgi:hypothetical protein|nr:carbohydrate binding family 9 domain-containing protein [Cytophagales bacterium]MCA6388947.1 carbohydrate binding family 9 domain-containing protein [Cytophagales bacterium]MCA6391365.1 carbohydrate binding family 9 domain-containing protein [Cytophagales bacterium]MCA6398420.1 carbohydrate binding family 9 domain-containing protein [Cytophagales bacterium]MCA6403792.1 carbohydrate binding family 9 domain-containing protein [Cytophagales bacterium]